MRWGSDEEGQGKGGADDYAERDRAEGECESDEGERRRMEGGEGER